MFTWHNEGHRVKLSDIYVPIEWVEHQKTAERVTEIKLKEYNEILHKVIQGNSRSTCRVFGMILFEGTPGRGNSRGVGACPPRPEKILNSKVSETNFRDSRVPVC